MFVSLFLVASIGSAIVGAAPQLSPYVVHEQRARLTPPGWVNSGQCDPHSVLPLRFGLTQPKLPLDELLHDVAHPDSPNYGQHWTPEEVATRFAPTWETVEAVQEWLLTYFSPERLQLTPSHQWLEVNATVAEAEELLRTKYRVFTHEESGAKHVACDAYKLPSHLRSHVDVVTPTVHFNTRTDGNSKRSNEVRANVKPPARTIGQPGSLYFDPPKTVAGLGPISNFFTDLKNCDKQTTLNCLRALYGLAYTPLSPSKNSFAIVQYTPQAYCPADLDMFFAKYSPKQVGQRPILNSIDGGIVQTTLTGFNYNSESNLDFEYGMGLVGPKQSVQLYQTGDTVEGASFNNLLDALDGSYCTFEGGDDPIEDGIYPDVLSGGYKGPSACGTIKPANVISTSYSYNEADLTPSYTARQCAEYAKLGLMGVTIIHSSGDYGVAGNGDTCLNPDGSQTKNGTLFNPTFPGTCPYVTSVGATQVNPNSTVFAPESACEQKIYSGGGFSNYFAIPSYQKAAVASYYKNHPPPYGADKYNNSQATRGFPDISANGANYVVSVTGNFTLVYGSSASAPVIGAILTMINDARITVGKKPIGFINPALYSTAFKSAFNDITSGGNQGCGTPGFTAVPGWDPVTGLGTPRFPIMLAKFLALP